MDIQLGKAMGSDSSIVASVAHFQKEKTVPAIFEVANLQISCSNKSFLEWTSIQFVDITVHIYMAM